MHFDIAVRQVSGPAGGSNVVRGLACEGAVPHTLHSAGYHKTAGDALLHCR